MNWLLTWFYGIAAIESSYADIISAIMVTNYIEYKIYLYNHDKTGHYFIVWNRFIWSKMGIPTCTTTYSQSFHKRNGNKNAQELELLHWMQLYQRYTILVALLLLGLQGE